VATATVTVIGTIKLNPVPEQPPTIPPELCEVRFYPDDDWTISRIKEEANRKAEVLARAMYPGHQSQVVAECAMYILYFD